MYRTVPFGILALAALTLHSPAEAATAAVSGIRLGGDDARTRFVMDVSRPLQFEIFTLLDPYRVVLDLPEVSWSSGMKQAGARGLVTGTRFGLFAPGKSRVVLDVRGPVRVTGSFLLKPSGAIRSHRLVIDLAATSREAFVRDYRARRKTVRPAPPPRAAAAPPKTRSSRKLIMIDPGHGGVDPGAVSRSGRFEKRVVLAHARELRRQLVGTGKYRVAMTRDRDVFVKLRTRVARARDAGADLFLSLHADSVGRPSVSGASVYTLSERASDKEAAALAARENKSDVIAGIDLGDRPGEVASILIDLAQRDTKNRSAIFANMLIGEMARVRKMLRNTHRFAGFAVLKAPDIPAVLVELGYLSNRADERLLLDAGARRRVAASIVRAIDRYFSRKEEARRSP